VLVVRPYRCVILSVEVDACRAEAAVSASECTRRSLITLSVDRVASGIGRRASPRCARRGPRGALIVVSPFTLILITVTSRPRRTQLSVYAISTHYTTIAQYTYTVVIISMQNVFAIGAGVVAPPAMGVSRYYPEQNSQFLSPDMHF
jgi:hypothetical protein